MFTGLITDTATLCRANKTQLTIKTQMDLSQVDIGASISISGCCLTVVVLSNEKSHWDITFDLNPETNAKTNFQSLNPGDVLNIERALFMGQPLDGHMVSGHVDCVGKIQQIIKDKESHHLRISFPADFQKWVVEKGSVAVEGISLTINGIVDNQLEVCIIPHTWNVTNLSKKTLSDKVHIEFDMMAKFFEKQAKPYFNNMNTVEQER